MRFVCLPILLLTIMATTASASLVVELMDPFTLRDSGWSMTIPDDLRTGVTVDAVTSSYIHLEISKEFYAGLNHDPFTPNVVTFTQRFASAVPSILITDESILNSTGRDWTSYRWWLEDPNAAFDKTSTVNSGFTIAPFTTMAWGPAPTGWASSYSHELAVSDGTLQNGDVYYPGLDQGWLAIKVNLDAGPQPQMRSFDLMQAPIPEPVTMALLLIGGACGVLRRNRR
jgi:hypothetical protein